MCLNICSKFAQAFVVLIVNFSLFAAECFCYYGYLRKTTCHQQDNVLTLGRQRGWPCISLIGPRGTAPAPSHTVAPREKGPPGMVAWWGCARFRSASPSSRRLPWTWVDSQHGRLTVPQQLLMPVGQFGWCPVSRSLAMEIPSHCTWVLICSSIASNWATDQCISVHWIIFPAGNMKTVWQHIPRTGIAGHQMLFCLLEHCWSVYIAKVVSRLRCRFFGGLIVGCLLGEEKSTLLSDCYTPVPGYWDQHPLVSKHMKAVFPPFFTFQKSLLLLSPINATHAMCSALCFCAISLIFHCGRV